MCVGKIYKVNYLINTFCFIIVNMNGNRPLGSKNIQGACVRSRELE